MRRVAHPVSPLRGSGERLGTDHSGDERDASNLDGRGTHGKMSFDGRFLGPHPAHRRYGLVHTLTLPVERAADCDVVLVPGPDTDPERQAPTRQDIDGRQVLREQDRVPHRERNDVRPEPHALGHRCRGGELRDDRPAVRIEHPFVGDKSVPRPFVDLAIPRKLGLTPVREEGRKTHADVHLGVRPFPRGFRRPTDGVI